MKKILIVTLMGLLLQAYSTTRIPPPGGSLLVGLQACYPFDNSPANFGPLNGSLMDGTIMSFGVTNTAGHTLASNTAYHFGGANNDVIEIQDNAFSKPTTALTVAGWIRIDNQTIMPNDQYVLFTKNPCTHTASNWEAYALAVTNHGGNLRFDFEKHASSPCGSGYDIVSTNVSVNTWYHVAFYVDNYIALLYVNGVQVANVTNYTPFDYQPGKNVYFGGSNEPGDYLPFKGSLDNFRFYNRQLSPLEISYLYTHDPICTEGGPYNPPPPPPPPPSYGCCVGNPCGWLLNNLSGDYDVPMNGNNFNFTMSSQDPSQVLIGYSSCSGGAARLTATDDLLGTGIKGYSSTQSNNSIGVYGSAVQYNDLGDFTGVLGDIKVVRKYSYAAGVAGFCDRASSLNVLPAGEDVGVYGNSKLNDCRWAGYFDGKVNVDGILSVNLVPVTSDRRFKTNIKKLERVSEKLVKLNGYTYNFRTEEFRERHFRKEEQIGFIAQELKELFPQLVNEDRKGFLSVNYMGMVPVLVAGIQEQQQQLAELTALIRARNGNMNTAGDAEKIALNQNSPDPFAESTVISYNVPAGFTNAKIVFNNSKGVIRTVDILKAGQGSLEIFAGDLEKGSYSYSLIVDDRIIDTKKLTRD